MKGIKKLVGAYVAVIATAALAVTSFAADYAVVPVFGGDTSTTVSVTTDTVTSAIDSAVAVDTSAADSADAKVATVEVKSVAQLTLNPSILKKLDKTEDTVLKIVSPKATISIDSSKVTKARKVDLSMKMSNSSKKTVIKMRSRKDFGCEVKITVTSCKLSAAKLKTAHVYCNGEDLGPVELDENGLPVITVTKGGTYEIK